LSQTFVKANLQIVHDANALARDAARIVVAQSESSIAARGVFNIALSGGSTPKRLYELLADPNEEFRSKISWDKTQFFWTDERHVGPEDPDSNFRMTNEAMLKVVPVPSANVHRFMTENPNAEAVAEEYETQLRQSFQNSLPRFDLVLLGLGPDGHTASLFPHTTALVENERLVSAPWVEKFNSFRLTLTLPVLNNSRMIVFLVSGEDKEKILSAVLEGPPAQFPAQAIQPANGELLWLVDKPAAAELVNKTTRQTPPPPAVL